MFTYPGYVTVNIFGGLSDHDCKEDVKNILYSHQEYPHTKQNTPQFRRYGRIGPRLYDLYKSPVGLFRLRVGRPGAIAAGGGLDENSILGRMPRPKFTRIGPLQLVIYVVKNHHAGEQKSHWNKNNKGNYHFKLCMPFFVLFQCVFCSPAWQFCTTWMASCKAPLL